jgi:hypothetical protein
MFTHTLHNYSDESYYFLTDDGSQALPMSLVDENNLNPTQTYSKL